MLQKLWQLHPPAGRLSTELRVPRLSPVLPSQAPCVHAGKFHGQQQLPCPGPTSPGVSLAILHRSPSPAAPSPNRYFLKNFLLRRKMSRLTLTLALSNIFMTATPSYCSCSRSCGRGGPVSASPGKFPVPSQGNPPGCAAQGEGAAFAVGMHSEAPPAAQERAPKPHRSCRCGDTTQAPPKPSSPHLSGPPAAAGQAPHLVVQLEVLHVDPHELGFHLEPA